MLLFYLGKLIKSIVCSCVAYVSFVRWYTHLWGDSMNLFGMRLKTLRNKKGLTQEQLADKLGNITKASVSRYEQSAMFPTVEVLIRLCEYFDVSSDYLLGLSDKIEFKISPLTDIQVQIVVGAIHEFERLNALENPAE